MEIVLPASWLRDCAATAKDSPLRSTASALAARIADDFLPDSGYPAELIPDVRHAIEAHSFSAMVTLPTREAMVVQGADRLDTLGIARCLMLGGAMGRPLYDPEEPFPAVHTPEDAANVLDHFYVKLLHISSSVIAAAGRAGALRRTDFMREYLRQLGWEIRADHEPEEDS